MRPFSRRSTAQRSRLTLSSSSSQTGSIGRSASALRPFCRSFSRRRRKDVIAAYLFLAPGFALFALVILYPITRAFQISLYHWAIVPGTPSEFIGFGNYTKALHDPVFWRGLVNSGFYMAFTVPTQIVIGLAIAVLLDAQHAGAHVLPHALLPAGRDELGRRLAALPLPLHHRRRPVQLVPARRDPHHQPQHRLARPALDGDDRDRDPRHLEGRRLVDDHLPRRAARRADAS